LTTTPPRAAPPKAAPPKAAPLSPCIRVCSVSGRTNWCDGCYRTLKEIATWGRMTPDERATVMADLDRRKAVAEAMAPG